MGMGGAAALPTLFVLDDSPLNGPFYIILEVKQCHWF